MSAETRFTPGPWQWMGNAPHNVYLATTHSGRLYIMGFERWGMRGAQPMFRENHIMVRASDRLMFEVGDKDVVGYDAAKKDSSVYRYDIRGISNPDAHLIASSPELYDELSAVREFIRIFTPREDHLGDTAKSHAIRIDALLAKARGE